MIIVEKGRVDGKHVRHLGNAAAGVLQPEPPAIPQDPIVRPGLVRGCVPQGNTRVIGQIGQPLDRPARRLHSLEARGILVDKAVHAAVQDAIALPPDGHGQKVLPERETPSDPPSPGAGRGLPKHRKRPALDFRFRPRLFGTAWEDEFERDVVDDLAAVLGQISQRDDRVVRLAAHGGIAGRIGEFVIVRRFGRSNGEGRKVEGWSALQWLGTRLGQRPAVAADEEVVTIVVVVVSGDMKDARRY